MTTPIFKRHILREYWGTLLFPVLGRFLTVNIRYPAILIEPSTRFLSQFLHGANLSVQEVHRMPNGPSVIFTQNRFGFTPGIALTPSHITPPQLLSNELSVSRSSSVSNWFTPQSGVSVISDSDEDAPSDRNSAQLFPNQIAGAQAQLPGVLNHNNQTRSSIHGCYVFALYYRCGHGNIVKKVLRGLDV